MRVLCVCLGNICRSPLAEGILRARAAEAGLDWTVDSAGTGDYHVGKPPDPRSEAEAAYHGIDISGQRARQLTPADFDAFDHILVMDASNFQDARALASSPEQLAKLELIMNYAEPGRNGQVPDPYWDDEGFAGVYEMLDEAARMFVSAKADA